MPKSNKDLKRIIRNMRRDIGFSVARNSMRKLGLLAIDIIAERTRRGYGVARTGGRKERLKSLSPPYVKYRKRNARKLAATTSPGRSNLTFTGQLLRSLVVKVATNRRVTWGPNRRKRQVIRGLTNEQVGEFVSGIRPFNNLSESEIALLVKRLDRNLQKRLKRN